MTEENQTGPSLIEQQLRDQITRYEQRLDEIAELVAHVRHELNNPLTGVLGQAQLLLRDELSEKARKRVLTIEELAMRLRDITSQLREVQKPALASGEQVVFRSE